MKIKTFIILLAICGVLAGVTYLVVTPGKSSDNKQNLAGKELLSKLPVNDIAEISIKSSESKVILAKGENVWIVKNKYEYPADFGKITEFAKKIKDMKITRYFNISDDIQKRLALFSPDKEDIPKENKGVRITLKDKSQKILSDIIVGKAREASAGRGGHYIMPLNEKTVYLVDKNFKYMDKKPDNWIKKDLVDISADHVAQVICKDSQGNVLYTLKRPEKGKAPEFMDIPEGKKIISSKLNDVFSALSSLNIEDVADPSLSADNTGFDKSACFEYHLFDGNIYTACSGNVVDNDDNKYYFKINTSFKEPEKKQQEAKTEDTASDTEVKPKDTKDNKKQEADKKEEVKDPAQLAAQADELNKKISPWTYIISKWKADRLITNTEDFFEKPKEKTDKKDS